MRMFNRFYGLCAVAVCSILYTAWFLTGRNFGDIVPLAGTFQTADKFDHRLVVFGDSWSDSETEEEQGKIWTDHLCDLFSCYQENLAQTARSPGNTKKNTGAVVDNDELSSFGWLSKEQVPDFKTQLDQWLAVETVAMEKLSEEERITRQERTTFVISFGIWDLWSLRETDYNTAVSSVDRRIKKLTEQLNRLDESFKGWGPTELQIIMTQTLDVTFLPAFTSVSGDEFKDAVRLLTQWNSKLKSAATEWKDGKAQWLYMFDTNAFVLDRIRDWQLYASGIEEENGMGKNTEPGWENVSAPCLVGESGFRVMMSKTEETTRCQHPEKYLFWDEMHLGPSAHKLMGSAVYKETKELLMAAPSKSESAASRRGVAV